MGIKSAFDASFHGYSEKAYVWVSDGTQSNILYYYLDGHFPDPSVQAGGTGYHANLKGGLQVRFIKN